MAAFHIGPNDKCPCGSGRKFKKCCRPQLLSSGQLASPPHTARPQSRPSDETLFPPIGPQLTGEILANLSYEIDQLEPSNSFWMPLLGVTRFGGRPQQHELKPLDSTKDTPDVRFGFYNNEYRPILEVVTDHGIETLSLPEPLNVSRTWPCNLAFTVDSIKREMEIFVRFASVAKRKLKGRPIFYDETLTKAGGANGPISFFTRIWRSILSPEDLETYSQRDLLNEIKWDAVYENPLMMIRVFEALQGPVVYTSVYEAAFARRDKSNVSLARKILTEAGSSVADSDDPAKILEAAGQTVADLTGELERLITEAETQHGHRIKMLDNDSLASCPSEG